MPLFLESNEDAGLKTKPDFKDACENAGLNTKPDIKVSGGLPKIGKGETKIRKFGWASEYPKFDISGGFLKNGRPKIRSVSFRRTGTKIRSVSRESFRRMEKPKDFISGGLPSCEEVRVVFRRTENNKLRGLGGLPKIGKRRTKVHLGVSSIFRRTEKTKIRFGWASEEQKTQRFVRTVSSGFPKNGKYTNINRLKRKLMFLVCFFFVGSGISFEGPRCDWTPISKVYFGNRFLSI
ncbi:unnamed protein product [Rhizophagus irregularis]|nr:unnamed protein product [Rhizophagus irregularis]